MGEGDRLVDILTGDITAGQVFEVTASGLATNGDQVCLFLGEITNPSLVAFADFGNAPGWDADAIDDHTSADPAVTGGGLADWQTVSLGAAPTWRYAGIMTGSADELLFSIADSNHWETTSDASWTGGDFTIVSSTTTSSSSSSSSSTSTSTTTSDSTR